MANISVMKNMSKVFKINPATYFFILTFFFTGLIKNIIIIYSIIIIHELGHVFIIKLLKYKVLEINIYPMGGITKIEKRINTKLTDDLLISLFGIIFQIILFFIIYLLKDYLNPSTYKLFCLYNKTIIIFNLLPIIPLDGYLIIRNIFELFFSYYRSYYFSFILSVISILFFITYNEIYSLNNYLVISFLIYKIIKSFQNFKYEYLKFLLERHLLKLDYTKIRHEKNPNLYLLKRETYHYFKQSNTYLSEKRLLMQKFTN